MFAHPTSTLSTIEHIPKPALTAFASALADSLDKAVAGPSDGEAWHDLLLFAARYLQQPERGGKRRNISSLLLKRLKVGDVSLDDESNQSKVARRRRPEACPCGAKVSARGTHGMSCRMSTGRSSRHHQINDLIWRALKQSDVPATKEPVGLLRDDGKRLYGLTLVPWQNDRCLTSDVTVVDTLATSYLGSTSSHIVSAAEAAAMRNKRSMQTSHAFTFLFRWRWKP